MSSTWKIFTFWRTLWIFNWFFKINLTQISFFFIFLGDGAGVGKGRTIATIIFENFLRGRRKAIWVSVSSDLKFDAERDMRDIGASKIPIHALNKMKYSKINHPENGSVNKGIIFATYSSLIGESKNQKGWLKIGFVCSFFYFFYLS